MIRALTSPQHRFFSFFKGILMNLGDTKIEHTEKPFAALLGCWNVHLVWLANSSAQALERGVPGLLSGLLKCAQLGCSCEHLAGACCQPTRNKDGAAGDASKPGKREQDPHMFLYEIVGEMSLLRVRCTGAAEVSLTCCPSSWGELPPPQAGVLPLSCLGFPSFPQGALAVYTLFTAVVCTTLQKKNHKLFPNNLCRICSKRFH